MLGEFYITSEIAISLAEYLDALGVHEQGLLGVNEDEHTLRVVVREVAVDDHAELRVRVVDPLVGYRVEGAANAEDVARIRQAGVGGDSTLSTP